ncbi:phospholipase D-like domain-containing protein [Candidatus Fokinia crypta]|uniref:Phospholipase D n=1 Tax=Candidatus Fokinia crypta TaxID=1920990 RepID=A0ABZ0USC1_9RICK|nr:phospholipase D-like domain-containing protein [Candidatus Fokinia cryptica]WPX97800.1 Putative hydrolase/phosphorylase [Candidatus Fokinia cryptica]
MKRSFIFKLCLLLLVVYTFLLKSPISWALKNVCFSPSNCCENNVIELTNKTLHSIDIAVYSLTNMRIYDALIDAKKRGVKIRIISDKLQSGGKFSLIPVLKSMGFNVRVNKKVKIEHNKFSIFDKSIMLTGSYNWTKAATDGNSENCIVDKRKRIISRYTKRFEELWNMYE